MKSFDSTKRYERFKALLIQYRNKASITQAMLAEKLHRPQSFVSKYEGGERRLDVIEFLEVAKALEIDPYEFLRELEKDTSK